MIDKPLIEFPDIREKIDLDWLENERGGYTEDDMGLLRYAAMVYDNESLNILGRWCAQFDRVDGGVSARRRYLARFFGST